MHPVITLTGVVKEPEAGLRILVGYYFKSTDINLRETSVDALSFVKDLHENKPALAIEQSLKTILRAHFDDAVINVSETNGDYTVSIEVTDGGKTIKLTDIHESVPNVLNNGA